MGVFVVLGLQRVAARGPRALSALLLLGCSVLGHQSFQIDQADRSSPVNSRSFSASSRRDLRVSSGSDPRTSGTSIERPTGKTAPASARNRRAETAPRLRST